MTITWDGAAWNVAGYPTICTVTVESFTNVDLFCAVGAAEVDIVLSLGSPCDENPSDTISVP